LNGSALRRLLARTLTLAPAEKWLVLGTIIGVAAGLLIIVFYEFLSLVVSLSGQFIMGGEALEASDLSSVAIHGADPLRLALLIVVGAGLSGLIVYRLAPEAEGHGTDAAIAAYHRRAAIIPFRVPLVKLVASGVAIGTGSSGGVEGPSVQMGAGIGSTIARVLQLSFADRRIALTAGIAAALSAMFRSPIGSAFFAAEVLYKRDLEAQALMPAFVASLVSFAVTAPYFQYHEPLPRIEVDPAYIYSPTSLLSLLGLGLVTAPFALIYIRAFRGAKQFFDRLVEEGRIPITLKPVLGAVGAAMIAVFFPLVAGSGKGVLALTISGDIVEYLPGREMLPLALLLVLAALAKIAATSLSIGSGASGGVFAPALLAGALVGLAYYHMLGGATPLPGSVYAYVGMAAFFGAAAKVPLATTIMVGEMGRNYFLIAPTLAAAYLARELVGDESIYESQIVKRPPEEAVSAEALLAMLREAGDDLEVAVGELADTSVRPARADEPLAHALDRMLHTGGRPLPVVDRSGRFLGVLDPADVDEIVQLVGGDLGTPLSRVPLRRPPTLQVYETIDRALEEMVEHAVNYVVVLDGERYYGIVTLDEISVALAFLIAQHLHHRAPGYGGRASRSRSRGTRL